MLATVTDRAADLHCATNNPDLRRRRSSALAQRGGSGAILIIDEAYVDTSGTACDPTTGLVRAHNNVVVLRTFSKSGHGLAGLRLTTRSAPTS